jgi:hypothetical protein
MKPRAKKKKLKKLFPYSDEFKQHKIGYMERLHKCTFCGSSRRAGYYICCSKCYYWVYEWQNKVKGLVEQTSDMMREYDARLSVCFYIPYIANIDCEITAYCDPHEVTETHRNGERLTGEFKVEYKARTFRTGKNLSLEDLRHATDPKKMLLDTAIELFRDAKETVNNYIDRNGKMATICGVPVPVVGGSWGEPRRKDHVIFKRL